MLDDKDLDDKDLDDRDLDRVFRIYDVDAKIGSFSNSDVPSSSQLILLKWLLGDK